MRIPAPILRLLHDEAVPVAEGPREHLINAIQCLILADERVQALTIPPDQMLTDLIRSAEARAFRCLFLMEEP